MGGAELLAQRQARWLVAHGVEARVVCVETVSFGAPRVTWQDDELDTIPVRRLHVQYSDTNAALRAAFDDATLVARFSEWVGEWKPDMMHLISGYLLGTAPLRAAQAHDVPTVVTLTDFWFLCPTIQLLKGDGTLCEGPETLECVRCWQDRRRIVHAIDERAPQVMQAFWRTAAAHNVPGELFGVSPLVEVLKLRKAELMRALNGVDAVLAVTHFLAEMYRRNGLTSSNLMVKPNGLDLDKFAAYPPRAPDDEIVFGYMGQISPIKGVDILLRAFHLVRDANPNKRMRLLVYGKLNAEPGYVKKLERLSHGDAAVKFAGTYEPARALELMAQMDALVVPSTWYENAPIVIQEAFAAGTPVIGTNVGGISELVRHEQNGLLFARGDAADLARMMQRMIDEPSLGNTLRAKIASPRTLQQDMDELMGVYERVLAQAKQVAA